jgi:hypothetical protein
MSGVQTLDGLGQAGKLLLVTGCVLAIAGGLVWLLSKTGLSTRLPGDIRIERPGFTCVVPLASSVLLSIVLTIVLNVVVRLLRR